MPASPKTLLLTTAALVLALGLAGCDSLDVENPNNLIEDDLERPAAAPAMANGTEAATARALGAILSSYSTVTDELTWIGSRDAWNELDVGILSNTRNEFSDAAFPYVGEARWQADEFITRVEQFRADGDLEDDRALIRLYLYAAIAYTSIADMFDDFAFSDREEAGLPVGPANMASLYDAALGYIDEALALGVAPEDDELRAALLGMRARARFARALWPTLNPAGDVDTAAPLVSDAAVASAADSALAVMDADFVYALELTSSSPDLVVGDLSIALQVNNRQELRIGDEYIFGNDETSAPDSIRFEDLVTGAVHPHLAATINTFTEARQYIDLPIVSAREMHLIKAEVALGQGDEAGFAEAINALRALDGLTPYAGQVEAEALLVNQRQANLFLQGRRLKDHYRFEDPSPEWTGERDAPGTFLPITITEIRANPNLEQ